MHRIKKQWKGTVAFPSSFIMSLDTTILTALTQVINDLITAWDHVFLVDVYIKPTNNIKIFLDADSGLDIDKCVKINRALYKVIEEKQWYPEGDFSLEVSSAGLDQPLKLFRQYLKNVGRNVAVTLLDGTVIEGKLVEAADDCIKLEQTTGKNKKATTVQQDIVFSEIKQTKVLITF